MWKDVRSQFVALGDGVDPEKIPEHYGRFYDEASKLFYKFGAYTGADMLPANFWPIICLLADQLKRIERLEVLLAASQKSVDVPKRGPGRPRTPAAPVMAGA